MVEVTCLNVISLMEFYISVVERGQLNWDENEDYEVEQIVDHCYEDVSFICQIHVIYL